jgi:hypothetical protein
MQLAAEQKLRENFQEQLTTTALELKVEREHHLHRF